jgi:hypothetical protein
MFRIEVHDYYLGVWFEAAKLHFEPTEGVIDSIIKNYCGYCMANIDMARVYKGRRIVWERCFE